MISLINQYKTTSKVPSINIIKILKFLSHLKIVVYESGHLKNM